MRTDKQLLKQWCRLLELPSAYSRFTKDLYESMYTRSSFIAHFNREGFFKARFQTLADFDSTLKTMSSVPELRALLERTPPNLVANARFKIVSMEAHVLTSKARVALAHVENLQKQFTKDVGVSHE